MLMRKAKAMKTLGESQITQIFNRQLSGSENKEDRLNLTETTDPERHRKEGQI